MQQRKQPIPIHKRKEAIYYSHWTTASRICSITPQRLCVFDSTPVSADWIHDAVAGWRGPNLTETPDLVPFDQPQQGVLLQLFLYIFCCVSSSWWVAEVETEATVASASFSYTLTVYLAVTSLINLTTATVQLQTKWPLERLPWLDCDGSSKKHMSGHQISGFFPVSHLSFPFTWQRCQALYRKTERKHLTTGLMPDFTHMVLQIKETEEVRPWTYESRRYWTQYNNFNCYTHSWSCKVKHLTFTNKKKSCVQSCSKSRD